MNQSISSFTLSNGLQVIVIERPQSLSVSLSFRIIAGSIYDVKGSEGGAHFLEHVVFDGTEKYPSEQKLSGLIEEKGGQRNGATGKETVEYWTKTMIEDVEVGFDYISQVLLHPLLKEVDIEREKKIIEQEINVFTADAEKYSQRAIFKILFPNSSLGKFNTGEIRDLQKITREKILSHMEATYKAGNAVLVICGDVPLEKIKNLAEKYFKDLKPGNRVAPPSAESLPLKESVIEYRDIGHSLLSMAFKTFPASDPRKYALDLIQSILTKGRTSRLFSEIREKRALAYVIGSYPIYTRANGGFVIRVGVTEQKIEETISVIKSELKKLTIELVSEDEIKKAYIMMKAHQAFILEDSLKKASYYSEMFCLTGSIKNLEEEYSLYEEVIRNPELIRETAKAIFAQDPAILILKKKQN
ncbi:MAG: pitrilysin family protein [Patescibacteria group bacterium]